MGGQTNSACSSSECYHTYEKKQRAPIITYQEYSDGHPRACGPDFIKYRERVASLESCQGLCSAESDCKFVAYSSAGVLGCGLYKSKCQGQTNSARSSSECYNTYEKKQYWYFGA